MILVIILPITFYLKFKILGIFKTSENDYRNLLIEEDGKPIKTYNFTQVFGSSTSQMALYENICAPLINDLIENKKSGLIFAYGITNSGKTFTITGLINYFLFI